MGVLHFYSIENSINLVGTCLKILWDSTKVRVETRYPTPHHPISVFYQGVYFCHTMVMAAAGSFRCH
jgi:hypothetical protein